MADQVQPANQQIELAGNPMLQNGPAKKTWGGRIWSCGTYCLGVAAAVTSAALSVLRYLDFRSWNNNPVIASGTSLGIGASAMTALECFVPRRIMDAVHQFQAKNALVELFIFTQVYLNLDETNPAHQTFKTILGILGGSWVVLKIVSIARRRMAHQKERAQYAALDANRNIEVLFEPRSGRALVVTECGKAAIGIALLTIYASTPGMSVHMRNIGIFLCSRRIGKYLVMGFHSMKRRMESAHAQEVDWVENVPLSLRIIRGTSRFFYLFSNNAWGALFVSTHPVAFMGIGVLTGGAKESILSKFQRAPQPSMSPEWETVERIQTVANVIFVASFGGWFLWGIIEESSVQALVECLALSSFAAGVGQGAYLTCKINQMFQPGTNTPLVNTLRFYTSEHPAWFSIIPLYIMTQYEGIGDLALAKYDKWEQAVAIITWYLYGNAFGNDWAQRYPIDRFPPTPDALMGKFLATWSRGEL